MKKFFLIILGFSLVNFSSLAWSAGVATSHQKSTETALAILAKHGNAVDAMVAASFVMNVVQPYKMGIGGGGILVINTPKKSIVFDHREEAPKSAHEKMLLDQNGKPLPRSEMITGPNPVGIPGTTLGLYQAHKKFGKLPWKTLLQPAIEIAKNGFPITQHFEDEIEANWSRLLKFPISLSTFSDSNGKPLTHGQILRQPILAQTLEKIAANGGQDFYTGTLASSWIEEAQNLDVKITLEDLKNYRVREIEPVKYNFLGFNAITSPPPSSSGLYLSTVLRFLDHYYLSHTIPALDSPQKIIILTEAIRFFQELREDNLADPPFGKINPVQYINSEEEKKAWAEIELRIRKRLDQIETAVGKSSDVYNQKTILAQTENSHTAHLSIFDDAGMNVAYTTTIEALFGSALVVPKHGFLLNNELSDFYAEIGKPNSPAPGKRPVSNMSPTIFTKTLPNGKNVPIAIFGAAGGPRIPTTLVQIIDNYYFQKLNAETAIAYPRFHPQKNSVIEIEKGYPEKTLKALSAAGYTLSQVSTIWSVAEVLIRRDEKSKWEAAAEPRYDGSALITSH